VLALVRTPRTELSVGVSVRTFVPLARGVVADKALPYCSVFTSFTGHGSSFFSTRCQHSRSNVEITFAQGGLALVENRRPPRSIVSKPETARMVNLYATAKTRGFVGHRTQRKLASRISCFTVNGNVKVLHSYNTQSI
jgi:hypothetical protein